MFLDRIHHQLMVFEDARNINHNQNNNFLHLVYHTLSSLQEFLVLHPFSPRFQPFEELFVASRFLSILFELAPSHDISTHNLTYHLRLLFQHPSLPHSSTFYDSSSDHHAFPTIFLNAVLLSENMTKVFIGTILEPTIHKLSTVESSEDHSIWLHKNIEITPQMQLHSLYQMTENIEKNILPWCLRDSDGVDPLEIIKNAFYPPDVRIDVYTVSCSSIYSLLKEICTYDAYGLLSLYNNNNNNHTVVPEDIIERRFQVKQKCKTVWFQAWIEELFFDLLNPSSWEEFKNLKDDSMSTSTSTMYMHPLLPHPDHIFDEDACTVIKKRITAFV